MIVDAHAHLAAGLGESSESAEHALAIALRRSSEAGIGATILFAGFGSDSAAANSAVAGAVEASRGRMLGFAWIHASRDRGRVAALVAEAVEDLGLVGLKVHGRDAPLTREVCEVARAFGLPLVYDPVGEVDRAAWFARAYPDLPLVVPHLGSFADDARAQTALLEPLARIPNLHADTSGVKLFDLLAEAVRRAGPEKLLFGSDAPWLHPGLELEKVRLLRLAPGAEAAVLGGNARRLLRAALRRRAARRRAGLGAVHA